MLYNAEIYREFVGDALPKSKICAGETYGYWSVLSNCFYMERVTPRISGGRDKISFNHCRCICGKEAYIRTNDVLYKKTTNCGCITNRSIANKLRRGTEAFDGYKICCICQKSLSINCFFQSKRSVDGLSGACKDCQYLKRTKNLYDFIPDLTKIYICEICNVQLWTPNQRSMNKGGKTICIDHCHKTGKYRGILCSSCNRGLSMFDDNPNYLTKAAQYIADKTSSID